MEFKKTFAITERNMNLYSDKFNKIYARPVC